MKLKRLFLNLLVIASFMTTGSPVLSNPRCQFFDGFVNNGDGTVTDPRNGLIWQLCSVGQKWDNNKCTGTAVDVNWFQAMLLSKKDEFLSMKDWRLPSKQEMQQTFATQWNCTNADRDPLMLGDNWIWSYSEDPSRNKEFSRCMGDCSHLRGVNNRWYLASKRVIHEHEAGRDAGTSTGPLFNKAVRLVRSNNDSRKEEFEKELQFALNRGDNVLMEEARISNQAKRDRETYQRELQEYRASLRRAREIGASRNGVSRTTFLDGTKAWGINCNDGYSTTSSLDKSIGYCGSASNGEHKCDFTLGVVAAHICR